MEMFCFGIFAGMILAVIFIAGGAVYASRDTKRTNDVDSDCRVYVPCRDRDRSGNRSVLERMDAEEVIIGLQHLRMALSRSEKEYLDYACDCVLRISELRKMIEERRECKDDAED